MPLLLCALLVAALGCTQFRQPIRLASGKTVDVVGLHWQYMAMSNAPAQRIYTVTYVTKLPIDPDILRPEAREVWEHYKPTLSSQNWTVVVIQAITQPSGGFEQQYSGYNFDYVRTKEGWSEVESH